MGSASSESDGHVITSPLNGTFYRAANADAQPLVEVGDYVPEGYAVGFVYSMKLMNEVDSDIAGTVVKILENGYEVEYGQALMIIRP
ncbi:acetyl-CoA carboxylase biotin carboxyl carrier protein [Nocardia pneumoniae]|uniref:acetyl-CoA carboxylase biotin carboxyl carrier protein n=1 Tax=Nocardia pneumoniae TaxID=228601 RepID=UPI0003015FF2|nr:biotin/lipoyl-containing protein [Nocardia pneumoniae]